MCSNYRPVTRLDRLLTFFGVERARDALPPDVDVFPLGLAPFIRLDAEGDPENPRRSPIVECAIFGLIPKGEPKLEYGRKTYNARCETVDRLRSFKNAWARGQRCIIPAECIYEPSYETGSCVWWSIQQPGAVPMGIAGIYDVWTAPDGKRQFTMAMITVNAEGHPVMQRMHKPGEEKRMVVILDPADYGAWLACTPADAKSYFRPWAGTLEASLRPVVERPPRRKPAQPPPGEDDLFA